jgi:hypothetical protein
MQMTNPNLTMKSLRQAVTEQQATAMALPPTKRRKVDSTDDDTNTTFRSGNDPIEVLVESNNSTTTNRNVIESSKTHVVTIESVEQEAMNFVNEWKTIIFSSSSLSSTTGLPPDIMAAWISRDGHDVPQSPEPPLFAPAPPKLSDTVRS